MAQWKNLESEDQLEEIKEASKNKTVAIFKHSTRCSISSMALNRLERDWKQEEMEDVDFYYLDLLSNRSISDKIAEELSIAHQSPQLIIIKNGEVVHHNSHMGISYSDLKSKI